MRHTPTEAGGTCQKAASGKIGLSQLLFWNIALILCSLIVGCEAHSDTEAEFDRAASVASLEGIVKPGYPVECQTRAKAALAELSSQGADSKPMFVMAIAMYEGPGKFFLRVKCFDEGRDLRGIRLREQWVDANGVTQTLEEDYPVFCVFWYRLRSSTVEARAIPAHLREHDQRKDDLSWLTYENYVLNASIERALETGEPVMSTRSFRDKLLGDMPPIYMSDPHRDRVCVQVCAYDREGRESEWIDVLRAGTMNFYRHIRGQQ